MPGAATQGVWRNWVYFIFASCQQAVMGFAKDSQYKFRIRKIPCHPVTPKGSAVFQICHINFPHLPVKFPQKKRWPGWVGVSSDKNMCPCDLFHVHGRCRYTLLRVKNLSQCLLLKMATYHFLPTLMVATHNDWFGFMKNAFVHRQ